MLDTVNTAPDYAAIKAKQNVAWSSGDYSKIGTTLQIVGEQLCEAIDLSAGSTVLDIAAGNGNFTLAAARRFADVTSTDYVPELLEASKLRAEAEGHQIAFQKADAENLPFDDNLFDVVASTFGIMFVADHDRAAREMARVCRPGGTIAMANWTPQGFIGQVFKTIGKYVPPAPGMRSPALWGTSEALSDMFGDEVNSIEITSQFFNFRYFSADHFMDYFKTWYGPVLKAFAAAGDRADELEADMRDLLNRFNTATDGTLIIPSEYVEVIIQK